jgi:DNA adenine methylase
MNQVSNKPKSQLLKWVGNKFRYANEIVSYFPTDYNTYYEPFLGTGAILATLAPKKAVVSDNLKSLIDFWHLVKDEPKIVTEYYKNNINKIANSSEPKKEYEIFKANYNKNPNGLDLLLISRTCYGGVLRFTKDGKLSTPMGPHKPISPESFEKKLTEWRNKIINTTFIHSDYKNIMKQAKNGDLIYCDPPYVDSQSILYGSQSFKFNELIEIISEAKKKGVFVALSIDGAKKSNTRMIDLNLPIGLFEQDINIHRGFDMLRRFQNGGITMKGEEVSDRLLLTWK